MHQSLRLGTQSIQFEESLRRLDTLQRSVEFENLLRNCLSRCQLEIKGNHFTPDDYPGCKWDHKLD